MKDFMRLLQFILIVFGNSAAFAGNIPKTILCSAMVIWAELILLRKDLEERHD